MIAVRADGNNQQVVDRRVLQALGQDGIVINIARGSVIDEPVLIELLEAGELGGAGLDVYEREPYSTGFPQSIDQRGANPPH